MNSDMQNQNTAVCDLRAGDRFCGWYLLKSAQNGTTSGGKPYLNLRLADQTGEIPGKAWDYAGPITADDAGQAVWVRGHVETYQSALQAKLEEIRLALHAINQQKAANAALLVSAYVRDIAGFTKGEADNEVGNGWGAYDLGLHDAYLILAAKDAGYDTLIMGLRDADKIRSLLSIPEEEEILSVIAIGKRAEEPAQRPRKPLEEIVTFF